LRCGKKVSPDRCHFDESAAAARRRCRRYAHRYSASSGIVVESLKRNADWGLMSACVSIIAMEGRVIEIVLTVCAIANPANCEEKYLQFVWDGSISQCMMAAEPYIAQWIGEHPEWIAKRWTCDYPGNNKKRRI
jgi:hypothetical protein